MTTHSETRKQYEACYRLIRSISSKIPAAMLPESLLTKTWYHATESHFYSKHQATNEGRYKAAQTMKKYIPDYTPSKIVLHRFGKRGY